MLVKNYIQNQKGNVTMMFAGSMMAIFGVVGASVDVSRMISAKNGAQNVLDASLLAAATEYQKSGNEDKAKEVAINFMTGSLPDVDKDRLKITVEPDYITGSYDDEVDNTFLAVFFAPTSPWSIDAKINQPSKAKTDFALALDVSSTMVNFNLFDGLKKSLKLFSEKTFKGAKSGDVTVSLAPFSNAVSFKAKYTKWLDPVKGMSQTTKFNGCFEYNKLGNKHALDKSKIKKRIAAFDRKINPTKKKEIPFCAKAGSEASFYLDNQMDLDNKISSLSTAQGTNTAEGLTWAWRMLSPSWQTTFGESLTHPLPESANHKKVIILLTDGKPYNIPTVKVKGEDKNQARKDALKEFEKVCNQIIAAGNIDLYTIVYGDVMSAVQRAAIRKCIAGNGESFHGGNSDQLSTILSHIITRHKEIALSK